jgi:hypothetical protein
MILIKGMDMYPAPTMFSIKPCKIERRLTYGCPFILMVHDIHGRDTMRGLAKGDFSQFSVDGLKDLRVGYRSRDGFIGNLHDFRIDRIKQQEFGRDGVLLHGMEACLHAGSQIAIELPFEEAFQESHCGTVIARLPHTDSTLFDDWIRAICSLHGTNVLHHDWIGRIVLLQHSDLMRERTDPEGHDDGLEFMCVWTGLVLLNQTRQ